jgi:hypothetical protein
MGIFFRFAPRAASNWFHESLHTQESITAQPTVPEDINRADHPADLPAENDLNGPAGIMIHLPAGAFELDDNQLLDVGYLDDMAGGLAYTHLEGPRVTGIPSMILSDDEDEGSVELEHTQGTIADI